jgi:glyceraldehyde-3-phosphate dehydrogenase (NAD(P))
MAHGNSEPGALLRVAVTGFGVIGKRVADAVRRQSDMELAGIADVFSDWRLAEVARQDLPFFAATEEAVPAIEAAGGAVRGTLDDLIPSVDVVVDCTPKGVGAKNAARYRKAGVKFIVQGGENHEVTGHSFVAEANYGDAFGRDATRVVSCNTTSIVRTLHSLRSAGLLAKARGTLLRRATDPWESHLGGIMNTLVPEPHIPSHQAPDARTVIPDLDVVTMAIKVPETLAHVHFWVVGLTREADRAEVLAALMTSSRTVAIRTDQGLGAVNAVKELMLDLGRPHGNLYEVALWEDLVEVSGLEAYYAYMVDNQAIVIPENIDAIRALCGVTPDPDESIRKTNESLGVGRIR